MKNENKVDEGDMQNNNEPVERKWKASKLAMQTAVRAWCEPSTENIVMIPELAEEFAIILDNIWDKPWLGNGTNRELIEEITTRLEIDGKLDYKTVDEFKTTDDLVPQDEERRDELREFAEEVSVLPLYIAEGDPDTTISKEVIICSEISGGAHFINGMPRELSLVRKLLNGKEYKRRYYSL
ncbi:MAG: hypothetical protein KAX49_03765 [Halanaerobiales bacterium]|nr:hypothetical protein [Halanaerobiales bacterium]